MANEHWIVMDLTTQLAGVILCIKFILFCILQTLLALHPFVTDLPIPSVFRIRFHWIQIRIQPFRLNTDPDPIGIQGLESFDDQN
jgi:hypothetical protein